LTKEKALAKTQVIIYAVIRFL